MPRLAARVPRSRLHRIGFDGVVAPDAKPRSLVVPPGPAAADPMTGSADAAECEIETARSRPGRICRSRLLRPMFDNDMRHRPNSGGGGLETMAAILERTSSQTPKRCMVNSCPEPRHRVGDPMITLCGFAVSNYYNKVKMVLLEKGIAFTEEYVATGAKDEATLTASPLGKVPFIRLEDGRTLCESEVIVEYLEQAHPAPPLVPADAWGAAKVRE